MIIAGGRVQAAGSREALREQHSGDRWSLEMSGDAGWVRGVPGVEVEEPRRHERAVPCGLRGGRCRPPHGRRARDGDGVPAGAPDARRDLPRHRGERARGRRGEGDGDPMSTHSTADARLGTWSATLLVAEREILSQIRSKAFIVSTVITLALVIGGIVLSSVLGNRAVDATPWRSSGRYPPRSPARTPSTSPRWRRGRGRGAGPLRIGRRGARPRRLRDRVRARRPRRGSGRPGLGPLGQSRRRGSSIPPRLPRACAR